MPGRARTNPKRLLKKARRTVILSPSLVILSEAKNLSISLRINSAKNPRN